MAWDSVPWAVGGGTLSVASARQLAYIAMDGNEGIIGAADLEVLPLAQVGPQVQIAPGACGILNRVPGYDYEMYGGRLPAADVVDVAGTAAGETRSDLVIARVEDPNIMAYDDPLDPAVGPYIFTRVVPGVSASMTTAPIGDSALPLARIDRGPGIGYVDGSHIVDLRFLANAQSWREQFTADLVGTEQDNLTNATTHGEYWPDGGGWEVRIPEWANRAILVATWGAVKTTGGNVRGHLWCQIGANETDYFSTRETQFDTSGQILDTMNWFFTLADTVTIPADIRGTVQHFGLRGRLEAADTGAECFINDQATVSLDLHFKQVL